MDASTSKGIVGMLMLGSLAALAVAIIAGCMGRFGVAFGFLSLPFVAWGSYCLGRACERIELVESARRRQVAELRPPTRVHA